MRGLRTQETEKFERFFLLVQNEAKERNAVFFLDSGEGNDFETETLEGEDLCGWLIPEEQAEAFEEAWENDEALDDWSEFIFFAFWEGEKNHLKISFRSF